VSGYEGTFRATCESVMSVLRENKESLMAVLEAFVYDPLISWRLLTPNEPNAESSRKENISEKNAVAYTMDENEDIVRTKDKINKSLPGK
jgi:FKBP12-rapamycin complex-associated protein